MTTTPVRKPTSRPRLLKYGFVLSLEAAASFLLVVLAAYLSSLFLFSYESESVFFRCSDAAILLSKSDMSTYLAAERAARELSGLSSLCLLIAHPEGDIRTCQEEDKQSFAFTYPVFSGGPLSSVTISCWERK